MHFVTGQKGGFTSTPKKHQAEMREGSTFLPQQQEEVSTSQIAPTVCPPGYEM